MVTTSAAAIGSAKNDTIVNARNKYTALGVVDIIDAIGTVTLDDDSWNRIKRASEALGALDTDVAMLVPNANKITEALGTYNQLKADDTVAKAFMRYVDGITQDEEGNTIVVTSTGSLDKIANAVEAFDGTASVESTDGDASQVSDSLSDNQRLSEGELSFVDESYATKIADLKAAVKVAKEIENNVKTANLANAGVIAKKTNVATAKEHYNALTDAQKALLGTDPFATTDTAIAFIEAVNVNNGGELATKEDLKVAEQAYEAYKEAAKNAVAEYKTTIAASETNISSESKRINHSVFATLTP